MFLENYEMVNPALKQVMQFLFRENGWAEWGAFGLFVTAAIVFRRFLAKVLTVFFKQIIFKKIGNLSANEAIAHLVPPLKWLIWVVLLYAAMLSLNLPESWYVPVKKGIPWKDLIYHVYVLLVIYYTTWAVMRLLDLFTLAYSRYLAGQSEGPVPGIVPFLKEILRISIIVLAVFITLGLVFQVNVAGIIAGLGIGGLAIALAGKETVENLFASITIFSEQPFEVGDLVKIDGIEGTVERIGFRSTRIRTLDKTYVTLPNKQMVDHPLENLTKRNSFRVKQDWFIRADTTLPKVESVLGQIRTQLMENTIIQDSPYVTLRRVERDGLIIELIYVVESTDFDLYLKTLETTNLQVLKILEVEGLYPLDEHLEDKVMHFFRSAGKR